MIKTFGLRMIKTHCTITKNVCFMLEVTKNQINPEERNQQTAYMILRCYNLILNLIT